MTTPRPGALAEPVRAYIGVGSNLDAPVEQVRRGIEGLRSLAGTDLVSHSSLYHNPAIGPGRQPDFVNAVAAIDTALEPLELLDELHRLENAQGRVRGEVRWAPRTLDLDLLLYGQSRLHNQRLTVPPPEVVARAFVLKPLHELAPRLNIPGMGAVDELLSQVSCDAMRPVAPAWGAAADGRG